MKRRGLRQDSNEGSVIRSMRPKTENLLGAIFKGKKTPNTESPQKLSATYIEPFIRERPKTENLLGAIFEGKKTPNVTSPPREVSAIYRLPKPETPFYLKIAPPKELPRSRGQTVQAKLFSKDDMSLLPTKKNNIYLPHKQGSAIASSPPPKKKTIRSPVKTSRLSELLGDLQMDERSFTSPSSTDDGHDDFDSEYPVFKYSGDDMSDYANSLAKANSLLLAKSLRRTRSRKQDGDILVVHKEASIPNDDSMVALDPGKFELYRKNHDVNMYEQIDGYGGGQSSRRSTKSKRGSSSIRKKRGSSRKRRNKKKRGVGRTR